MHKVILYGTSTCGFCRKARAFFDENHVEYTDIDVGEDQKAAEEIIKRSGQMGVPVIDIDGQLVLGFDKPRLAELLGVGV
ncbi:glutaredoxin family protein [Candidatus Berkelbacteria bacterium]|nr:glutaredoxin family protein [Candidatus Berkelbacteria bacterium]